MHNKKREYGGKYIEMMKYIINMLYQSYWTYKGCICKLITEIFDVLQKPMDTKCIKF